MSRQCSDQCGEGTEWGCRRPIGDGEPGHVVRNAVTPRPNGSRTGPWSAHVIFHPECCPCAVDPSRVQPSDLRATV